MPEGKQEPEQDKTTANVRWDIVIRNGKAKWEVMASGEIRKDDPAETLADGMDEITEIISHIKS